MTPKKLAAVRAALLRLREELVRAGPARIEPNRQDPATTGVADEDAQALSEMLQSLASARNRGQSDLLALVDKALHKLDAAPEDFGLCEDCEEEIPAKRLAVMPYAPLCAECQAKREPRRQATRRHLTDYK
ncbi:TraR/DksA family transcriptional regulator [Anaeromyxobacter paludicola]|uniref:Molecular chaperone DnaK n=1 Tax=Anaeromyxobacter paludicola TaxID=2918171 RepID=A0ABM7X6U8_9BACT|nr:TraR/DksA family transcriptional regulator [Anaeromyxobacter paludicola]BDG07558.1 molecular chaperone DnaK [Anaeromyxobacter paludicola]